MKSAYTLILEKYEAEVREYQKLPTSQLRRLARDRNLADMTGRPVPYRRMTHAALVEALTVETRKEWRATPFIEKINEDSE